MLLQNHGAMAVGETLDRAYAAAVALEEAAQIFLLARLVGEPIVLPAGGAAAHLPLQAQGLRAVPGGVAVV